jgi:hypothetical protein
MAIQTSHGTTAAFTTATTLRAEVSGVRLIDPVEDR